MPEKDPNFWSAALAWLTTVSPQLYALALSVVVAVTRVSMAVELVDKR